MNSKRFLPLFKYIFWTIFIGIIVGSCSAFFLFSLELVSNAYQSYNFLIYLLPFSGLLIIYFYSKEDVEAKSGNSSLIRFYSNSVNKFSWKMAPLIFISTILTHLFGGSAGREGTAVQMGGSIAMQLARFFVITNDEKKLILLLGVAAGFSSVFGTPWAGFVFAFEFFWSKEKSIKRIFLVLLSAFFAHYVCLFWGIKHSNFPAIILPIFSISVLINCVLAGAVFGLTAMLFVWFQARVNALFSLVSNSYVRVFVGGSLLVFLVKYFGLNPFVGLGLDGILSSFESPQPGYYFFIKLILTVLTLSAGFKGGEVTPLFFIGATLGSALVWIFPLPVSFLAALGLIAVFASAAQVPLASIIMGTELFGVNGLPYFILVCFFAFLTSGFKGIYSEHPMGALKRSWFSQIKHPWARP